MSLTSRRWPAVLLAITLWQAGSASHLFGYALETESWPLGSSVPVQLGLGASSSGRLQDGFATFDDSAADALATWKQYIKLINLSWSTLPGPGGHDDGLNQAFFASTVYGQAFGTGVIAVTLIHHDSTTTFEADNVFNSAMHWNSYRGPLQYNSRARQYILDFHRVALHEFGHTLGLAHPDEAGQGVTAIMNSHISDLDHLADDDIAGMEWLYDPRITSVVGPSQVSAGDTFSYQITANNKPTSFGASGLPAGLQLNSSTGVITGTFLSSGNFTVTITANGIGGAAAGTLTFTVAAPTITSPPYLYADIGQPVSYYITATGHPTSYGTSSLPSGLSLDPNSGLISGTPVSAGTFDVNVVAHTRFGDATATIQIAIAGPYITSPAYAGVIQQGDPFNYQTMASTDSSGFDATGLPEGFHLDRSTGLITGVFPTAGTFSFTVIAHTAFGDATANIVANVVKPTISSGTTSSGVIGSHFSYQITSSNQAFGFTSSPLPAGLTLNTVTGLISGIPTLSGNYTITVYAHGGAIASAQVQFTIQVPNPVPEQPLGSLAGRVRPIVFDPARSRVYLGADDGLFIANISDLSTVKVIPFDVGELSVAMSPDGSKLWYAPVFSTQISCIDLNTLNALPPISVTGEVTQIYAGLDNRLYLWYYGGDVIQVDASTGASQARVAANALWPVMSPDHRSLFAFEDPDTDRYDVSSATAALSQQVALPIGMFDLSVTADNHELLLLYSTDNQNYTVIRRASDDLNRTIATLNVGEYSAAVSISPDKSILAVSHVYSPNVDLYDSRNGILLHDLLPSTFGGEVLAFDPSGKYLYVGAPSTLAVYSVDKLLHRVASPPKHLTNVSTRLQVGTGDKVEIGGFIIAGQQSKKVLLRAIAPSLAQVGLSGVLADPRLQILDSAGSVVATNDNWNSSRDQILASGFAPRDEHESVIIATLVPGSYTAMVSGITSASGIALFELYDLEPANSTVKNMSTRGNVGAGDNVMIGGFIVGGDQPTNVIVRALGPTLADFGVGEALNDPTLELRDKDGVLVAQNDNWKSDQRSAIQNSGYAPPRDAEAAILATLQPGNYTAIVRGKDNTTGVALIEVYNLDAK